MAVGKILLPSMGIVCACPSLKLYMDTTELVVPKSIPKNNPLSKSKPNVAIIILLNIDYKCETLEIFLEKSFPNLSKKFDEIHRGNIKRSISLKIQA
jgi:hypothetical protein